MGYFLYSLIFDVFTDDGTLGDRGFAGCGFSVRVDAGLLSG